MKKGLINLLTLLIVIAGNAYAQAVFNNTIFEHIRLTQQDLPEGFVYGTLPDFAQRVLGNNPTEMNQAAIRKLVPNVYPNGDPNAISSMHVSIIASKENPYDDDIVCWMFVFRDGTSARREIAKLNEYAGYNRDRALVISQDNLAVFMHVDSTDNFHYLTTLSGIIQARINGK